MKKKTKENQPRRGLPPPVPTSEFTFFSITASGGANKKNSNVFCTSARPGVFFPLRGLSTGSHIHKHPHTPASALTYRHTCTNLRPWLLKEAPMLAQYSCLFRHCSLLSGARCGSLTLQSLLFSFVVLRFPPFLRSSCERERLR